MSSHFKEKSCTKFDKNLSLGSVQYLNVYGGFWKKFGESDIQY